MIINTHSHIYDEAFDADREEVFKRAIEAGVEMLLLPNCDEKSVEPMMEFYEKHSENVRVMMGLHPEETRNDYKDKLKIIEQFVNDDIIGIGEIGLDFYWDDTFKKEQIEVLSEQLHWAKELGLPVSLKHNLAYGMIKIKSLFQKNGFFDHAIVQCCFFSVFFRRRG